MKKTVLVFIDWYMPAFKAGGQIPSVANIINLLKQDLAFSVITSDRDSGDLTKFRDIVTDKWIENFDTDIKYLSPGIFRVRQIFSTLKTRPDIVYLNSFFSFYFTIIPLVFTKILSKKTKIILAPRGMLGTEALNIKSKKKRFFIKIAKFLGLYSNIVWHASSSVETQEIKAIFGENIFVKEAIDISLIPDFDITQKNVKRKNAAHFFFLSRICRKKNLKDAIKFFENIKGNNVCFDIYGPIEDNDYWDECLVEISKIKSVTINYKGLLVNNQIVSKLKDYHFMLLPTMNENYGHVIAEALSIGCPVIISTNTPWRNLEKSGVGWDIPLEKPELFINVINNCISMDNVEFSNLSNRAVSYVKTKVFSPEVIADNKSIFEVL